MDRRTISTNLRQRGQMHIFTAALVIHLVNCVIWVALNLPVRMKSVFVSALVLQLIGMCVVLQKTRFLFGHFTEGVVKVPCCKSVGISGAMRSVALTFILFINSSQPTTNGKPRGRQAGCKAQEAGRC